MQYTGSIRSITITTPACGSRRWPRLTLGHVNGQTIPSREVGKGFVAALLSAFPDIHYSIEDALQADDHAAVRWSATATHTGNFFGLAPTQKKVSMIGMTIFRVENGQVTELWDVWDEAGLMKQLGASR